MNTCPNCGHENPETATACENCGHDLGRASEQPAPGETPAPEVSAPDEEPAVPAEELSQPERRSGILRGGAPLDPARPTREGEREPMDWRRYAIGIALGLVPVILAWLALGLGNAGGPLAVAAGISYLGVLIGGIVCVIVTRLKYVGYGLLTMLGVGPIVWGIGCIVILAHPPLPKF